MNGTDSKNLAPMVFVSTLRNAATEGEPRGSRVVSVLAQRAASEGSRWTRAVATTTTASLALIDGDEESNCYEVYRLSRDAELYTEWQLCTLGAYIYYFFAHWTALQKSAHE